MFKQLTLSVAAVRFLQELFFRAVAILLKLIVLRCIVVCCRSVVVCRLELSDNPIIENDDYSRK